MYLLFLDLLLFLEIYENEHSIHEAEDMSGSSTVEEAHAEYFNGLREQVREERTNGNITLQCSHV